MTDSVKEAVEYFNEGFLGLGITTERNIKVLITAAEKSDAWENSAKAILVANVIYKDVNEEIRDICSLILK